MNKTNWCILLLLLPILMFSQTKTVIGKVKDAAGNTLPGVNVLIKQTKKGTATDFDGSYKITVPNDQAVLVFSYIGYASQEVQVGGRKEINISLNVSGKELDEVVVTALNIKRETKTLTYARQSINTEGLGEDGSLNFVNTLNGKAAGLQIVSAGTPTGSTRVVVRGITSITGSNQPLYVIDGIPLETPQGDGNVSTWNNNKAGGDIDYGNPISSLNPDDIEAIEILKGANAAALYGSRAGNGVILITTKKGKSKKGLGVTFNSNIALTDIMQWPEYQYIYGAGDNGRLVGNATQLDPQGRPIVSMFSRAYGAIMVGQEVLGYNNQVIKYLPQYDGIKDLYRTGLTSTNSVSFDSANDQGSYRLSYSNVNSYYTLINQEGLKRNNFNLNTTRNFTKDFNVALNVNYTNEKVNNRIYRNGSNRNPNNSFMYILPNMGESNLLPYEDSFGNAYAFRADFINPYWNIYENSNEDSTNKLIGGLNLSWKLNNDFTLTGKALLDYNNRFGDEFNNKGATYDIDGFYRTFDTSTLATNLETVLRYNKKLTNFSFSGFAGANMYNYNQSSRESRIQTLMVQDVKSLANSSAIPEVVERDALKKVNSLFASATFGYKDTFFVDATARNDWSSTLPADNNSYFYPSVGGSILLSEILPKNEVLSFLKLRASYAQVGNDTSPYNVLTAFKFGGLYNGNTYLALDTASRNPELKPELTTSNEFGVEANFFKKRFSVNATYYTSSTINQIIPVQTSPAYGFSTRIINAGEIKNDGFEVFLKYRVLDSRLKWDMEFNWSNNHSEVVSLINGVNRLPLRTWFNVNVWAEVGRPLGEIRGTTEAKDPTTGQTLVSSNGRILFNTDQYLGNNQPDYIGGLRNAFTYKGINLSFLVDFRKGGDLFSATYQKAINNGLTLNSLDGREDFLFSNSVLGESTAELQGIGLFGNPYNDSDRPKGIKYENAAFGVRDANGNWVAQRDANGNVVQSNIWLNPQNYGYDSGSDQARTIYDTSFIKLREVILGYTIPKKFVEKTVFQDIKFSVVGRNLFFFYQNTPDGIDPEASSTSGNGQGIEYASSFPTRTISFNLNLKF
jgi:TonB-linked SusC/RagA family outer membrane protein